MAVHKVSVPEGGGEEGDEDVVEKEVQQVDAQLRGAGTYFVSSGASRRLGLTVLLLVGMRENGVVIALRVMKVVMVVVVVVIKMLKGGRR